MDKNTFLLKLFGIGIVISSVLSFFYLSREISSIIAPLGFMLGNIIGLYKD